MFRNINDKNIFMKRKKKWKKQLIYKYIHEYNKLNQEASVENEINDELNNNWRTGVKNKKCIRRKET